VALRCAGGDAIGASLARGAAEVIRRRADTIGGRDLTDIFIRPRVVRERRGASPFSIEFLTLLCVLPMSSTRGSCHAFQFGGSHAGAPFGPSPFHV
jgi:hypothetical protein